MLGVAACGPPPRVTQEVAWPTLDPDPPVEYGTVGLANLRRAAGAASIDLELGGDGSSMISSPGCSPATSRVIHTDGTIYLAKGCFRCTLALVDEVGHGAADSLELPLRSIAAALGGYPKSFLDAARVTTIALCRKLVDDGDPALAEEVAGTVDQRARRLLVSVSSGNVHRATVTFHHELFHLFDYSISPNNNHQNDAQWEALNPAGFRYLGKSGDVGPGFVDDYAKTSASEDKASVFHYIMAHTDEFCARAVDDPVLMAKGRLIRSRIERAIPVADAAFVTRRARCLAGK